MTPQLRELKRQHVSTVFNGAIHFLDRGDRDTAFEYLTKLQGMMAAFHQVDDNLYAYTKLAESSFLTYAQTRTCSPFMHRTRQEGRLQ